MSDDDDFNGALNIITLFMVCVILAILAAAWWLVDALIEWLP